VIVRLSLGNEAEVSNQQGKAQIESSESLEDGRELSAVKEVTTEEEFANRNISEEVFSGEHSSSSSEGNTT